MRSDFRLHRLIARQARPYWSQITGILFLSLLATPLALLTPVPLKVAIDSGLGSRPPPEFLRPLLGGDAGSARVLVGAAALLVGVALLGHIQDLALTLLRNYTGEQLVLGMRTRLFSHLQRLSLSYHDGRGTSDSIYRVQYDAPSIRYLAVDGLIPFVAASFTLAGMLYVTARIDWQLALVALAVSPLLFSVARAYRRRLRRGARRVKVLESDAMGVIQEVLTLLRVVKVFGQEGREQERFAQRSREGVRARLRLVLSEEVFGLLVGAITALGTGAVLLIGARHVRSGALTLGDLMLVIGYLAQLYEPLRTMSKQLTSIQDSLASAERIFSLLEEAPDVRDHPSAQPLPRSSGRLAFDHVSFAYPGCAAALHDLSFAVGAGSWVGVEGTTGAGKTTLVSLIARLYDPNAGRILLDGVDLRDYRLADLRRQIGFVLQEPVLFAASIAENIAYARPDADHGEIVEAAKAACAHDFIAALPDGYDTLVGERGMRLSGGERQRLSLARAFLKDAPILVLDEPTSALDAGTEAALIEIQRRVMHGRTCIIVAHRPQLLAGCDLRLHLEHGRLVRRRRRRAPATDTAPVAPEPRAPEPRAPEPRAPEPRAPDERANPPRRAMVMPPARVRDVAGRLLAGRANAARFLAVEPLDRAVHRLRFEVDGQRASVVVKRLTYRRARINRLVAERWLPGVGLAHACPRVRGSLADRDGRVWQIYQDLEGHGLDRGAAERRRVEAAVALIADVHGYFAGNHRSLGECRTFGDDLGFAFFETHVARCLRHLGSVNGSSSKSQAMLCDRLLTRIGHLYEGRDGRARVVRGSGGPDTLLHGDLWTTNMLVTEASDGYRARLIDWDHAGTGPMSYDLSTFLFRFPPGDRPWILSRYRDRLARFGVELPSDALLNVLFETAEISRYACCLGDAALAASRRETWGFDQMAEIETWFEALQPALPGP